MDWATPKPLWTVRHRGFVMPKKQRPLLLAAVHPGRLHRWSIEVGLYFAAAAMIMFPILTHLCQVIFSVSQHFVVRSPPALSVTLAHSTPHTIFFMVD